MRHRVSHLVRFVAGSTIAESRHLGALALSSVLTAQCQFDQGHWHRRPLEPQKTFHLHKRLIACTQIDVLNHVVRAVGQLALPYCPRQELFEEDQGHISTHSPPSYFEAARMVILPRIGRLPRTLMRCFFEMQEFPVKKDQGSGHVGGHGGNV